MPESHVDCVDLEDGGSRCFGILFDDVQSVIKAAMGNFLVLVTGEYEEPDVNSIHRALWERTNDMIISWILNTIVDQISNSLNFINTDCDHWKELQEHYSQLDGQVLLMNPMPTVAKAYIMIRKEEKQREARFDNASFRINYSQWESSSRNNNQGESSRGSNFKKGMICGNYGKEGHIKEECYKIFGYPVGHPLHGKYKSLNQILRNNAQDNNMINQLNQMILTMQNNKEINGVPFMSNEGKPKLITSCFTKSWKFIASYVSA
uniref:Reverse transcriptase, RNA-dependent DNA polymerase, Gag-polypeptide of LTR copia-type n=1 Tax=Tanacetum cinerariifolium TaxID=118510 RepID=A0A6L2K4P4_TANCI|nr:reverse transcriptase, RNA-dependent DNA polymerase, Gag-polypeptide of LTR copia-type [Tanacetum cinerariifolium]